jgi:murein DD-endopeptidase MepM/ murein hydrolase activator NlpD
MRALRPSDVVVALRDPSSHALLRVQYRRGRAELWEATRGGDGAWSAESVQARVESVQLAACWEVPRGPPGTHLRALGLEPEVLVPVGEALTSLGLSPRLREGDLVRVVLEEERLNDGFYRYGPVLALDHQGPGGHHRGYRFRMSSGPGDLYDAEGLTVERGVLRGPVTGARLSSRFDLHRMHPVLHVLRPHLGVDFAAPMGTPVAASAEGVVLSVGPSGPSGNLVRVLHRPLGLETGYAHLSRFAPGVRQGVRVRAGQLLGYVGSTGRSTGPHLHFSVRRGGAFVDPLVYHTPRQRLPDDALAAFRASVAALGAALDGLSVDAPAVALDAPAAPPTPSRAPSEAPPEEGPEAPEDLLDEDEDTLRGD